MSEQIGSFDLQMKKHKVKDMELEVMMYYTIDQVIPISNAMRALMITYSHVTYRLATFREGFVQGIVNPKGLYH